VKSAITPSLSASVVRGADMYALWSGESSSAPSANLNPWDAVNPVPGESLGRPKSLK
jgi:hypothetical protein